jgi:cbb3-type cytochrome oxidase subunit 3
MIKTILIIVISVTIVGVLFFLYTKKALKKRLDYYLSKNNKTK